MIKIAKNKIDEKYIIGGIYMILGIIAYFVIQNIGHIIFENSWLASLLNFVITPVAFLIGGILIFFGFMAIILGVKDFKKFVTGTIVLIGAILYIILPDFLPGPIDDVVVGAIGTWLSTVLISSSRTR